MSKRSFWDPGPGVPPPPPPHPPPEQRPPGPVPGLSGVLGQLLGRIAPRAMATEDWLVLAVLWLLYRESGDREFLLALAAYVFL